jgi:hypothetical protein
MSVEPAESAALRVTWRSSGCLYDLRWYGSADYVVPLWWIGFVDPDSGEPYRTEVFHSDTDTGPGPLHRWLVDVTDHDTAARLVRAVAAAVNERVAALDEPVVAVS